MRLLRLWPLLLLGALLPGVPAAAANHAVPAIQDTETPAQHDARLAWWREARFGLFIHWGLYAIPAGTWNGKPVDGIGEWIMHNAKIPVADYQALAPRFNPVKFNADAWVALAQDAGMRYIIITAKHHDGFAMDASKVSAFNIHDATPFKRDPLAELNAAAQKRGVRLGFYYSQAQDWTAPGGGAIGGHWDKAQDGDFAHYFETKAIPQVRELLSNYSPVPAVLWFDTPEKMTPELAGKMVVVLNAHPQLIWNNRLGGGYAGDTETPEQQIPAGGFPGRDWETCMTINDTWGYKADDHNFKSVDTLLHNLVDIASKGGNYLLNVGPDATGVIPQPEQDRLRAIGRWLRVNGESIYGTQASPLHDTHMAWDWRATAKPGRLYLHLLQWVPGPFAVGGVPGTATKAYLLADPAHAPLLITQNGAGLQVTLPSTAPDPLDSVVVVELK